MTQALIQALQNPALYPHPVEAFQVVETHISWVILTGPFAYKIKKPVNFGFLDFSSLEARRHFCEQELLLNQRLTQGLYLEVLPIAGSEEAPQLGGQGPALEYALKMRQFPQSQLLSAVQARGELSCEHIDQLATQIARFHQQAPRVPVEHELGSAEAVMAPVRQNFEQIRQLLPNADDLPQLLALEAWAESSFARLEPQLQQRKAEGFIRECHGDIHLGNATLLDGQVVLFDCIEFNEPFRFTDVYADIAFLAMDLEDRGLRQLSSRLISGYLEQTGDYAGLELLNFYKAYRAMVRAKIALFSLAHQPDEAGRQNTLQQYRNYANLAEGYCAIPSPFLAITCGVSAVGKSHVAQQLVDSFGAIRVRSDVERKRLFGQQTGSALHAGIYSADASQHTYARLHELAGQILHAGFAAVLDATYLKAEQRRAAADVAEAAGAPFLILDCQAEDASISRWLQQRQAEGSDPSDATLEVIQDQQRHREPLDAQERGRALPVFTDQTDSLQQLIQRLQQHLPRA